MSINIGHITLLVQDYDEAIDFYTRELGFSLIEDTLLEDEKRWILISPNVSQYTNLVIVKALTQEQKKAVGIQAGDGVFMYLYTDDIKSYFNQLLARKISIVSEPVAEPWGIIAKFRDIYGNLIELIQPLT